MGCSVALYAYVSCTNRLELSLYSGPGHLTLVHETTALTSFLLLIQVQFWMSVPYEQSLLDALQVLIQGHRSLSHLRLACFLLGRSEELRLDGGVGQYRAQCMMYVNNPFLVLPDSTNPHEQVGKWKMGGDHVKATELFSARVFDGRRIVPYLQRTCSLPPPTRPEPN